MYQRLTDNISMTSFCAQHISVLQFYTFFNISHLKIVSSSEMKGRQSNKVLIQRGGNEKGSSFLICEVFSSFSLHISGKEFQVEASLSSQSPFCFCLLFFPFSFSHSLSLCFSLPPGTLLLGTPREFPSHSSTRFFRFCLISFRLLFTTMSFFLRSQLNRA